MNATPSADDQRVIDEILTDVEPERADDVRPLLAELRSLAHGEPVAPGPLAALLLPEDDLYENDGAASSSELPTAPAATAVLRAVPGTGAGRPARPGRRRRPLAAAAIIAAAAVGAGAAAAAADEGFRSSVNEGISTIVGVLGGHSDPKPLQHGSPASGITTTTPTSPAPAETPSGSATQPTAPQSVRPEAPRATAAATPSPTSPGALPQLPGPDLGVPVPTLPTLPGGLPAPSAPAGQLPGSLR
jgi:hypothetical protein